MPTFATRGAPPRGMTQRHRRPEHRCHAREQAVRGRPDARPARRPPDRAAHRLDAHDVGRCRRPAIHARNAEPSRARGRDPGRHGGGRTKRLTGPRRRLGVDLVDLSVVSAWITQVTECLVLDRRVRATGETGRCSHRRPRRRWQRRRCRIHRPVARPGPDPRPESRGDRSRGTRSRTPGARGTPDDADHFVDGLASSPRRRSGRGVAWASARGVKSRDSARSASARAAGSTSMPRLRHPPKDPTGPRPRPPAG